MKRTDSQVERTFPAQHTVTIVKDVINAGILDDPIVISSQGFHVSLTSELWSRQWKCQYWIPLNIFNPFIYYRNYYISLYEYNLSRPIRIASKHGRFIYIVPIQYISLYIWIGVYCVLKFILHIKVWNKIKCQEINNMFMTTSQEQHFPDKLVLLFISVHSSTTRTYYISL